MLVDRHKGVAYFAVSLPLVEELAHQWSEPVQIKLDNGELVLRSLGQPVKGVYIVEDVSSGFGNEERRAGAYA